MSAPVENLVERLHAKRSGKGWLAKCPVHEDHKPSLSLTKAIGTHSHSSTLPANAAESSSLAAQATARSWPV
jgi:hypothetical protein